ncbi:hypothetical protein FSARC_8913 [Fusarium sarcochroum]|uniref:BTB domain-containing protein n=1 Tax=Fusarium sarcochroum TaxID=1208366 RepID=A0A8H4TS34_9HYPO|nr:hypothetical protein FSARC_8913 [Fusarium sarcochroum]
MAYAEVRSQMARAREKGEFTDFTFLCGESRIPAHKVIVCGQSPVFRAACTGKFKNQEASSSTYDLSSHPVEMVQRMVDCLYTGGYSVVKDKPDDPTPSSSPLSIHVMMYALGDKYNVTELMDVSTKEYSERLGRESEFEDFLSSLPDVYSSTPEGSRGLRDAAVNFVRIKADRGMDGVPVPEWLEELAAACPDFIKELLYDFLEHPFMAYCDCGNENGEIRVDVEVSEGLWRRNDETYGHDSSLRDID